MLPQYFANKINKYLFYTTRMQTHNLDNSRHSINMQ